MPAINALVSAPIHKTFRVDQVAGMFDLKLTKTASAEFHAEVPAADEDWQIGIIVGPSGSGKTTMARKAFGADLCAAQPWPEDKAVIDGFGEQPIKDIVHTLTSVGFSSPPSWVKPYAVLSNGEKFRCDLARALLADRPLIAYDEFTSVVDRTVAKIGSAAVSKAIRKGRIARKFVAVTCHYDIVDWLEPDWVLDMASGRLARGRLRRPEIKLEIAPIHRCAWVLFRRHHYLNTEISVGARCFCAFIDEEPVAFSAWIHSMTRKRQAGDMREHRTVVLPDYQGVGIGNRLSEFCASIWSGVGGRASSCTSHPAMIAYRSASPVWHRHRLGMVSPIGRNSFFIKTSRTGRYDATAANRVTGGFRYVGPPMPREQAEAFVGADRNRVLELIHATPGCSTSFLARHSGLNRTGVQNCTGVLLRQGLIVRNGPGGNAGRQHAFYPVPEALSE